MTFGDVLVNLQCEMVAERSMVNPDGISWLQYDILFRLHKEGELVPSNLSVILGVSRGKLSKALKDLKIWGYISQSPNPDDGRELRTSLTEKGESLLATISKNHSSLNETASQALTIDEQKIFSHLATKIANSLKEKRIEGLR